MLLVLAATAVSGNSFILVFNGLWKEGIKFRFGSTLYLAELQCVSTIGGCNIRPTDMGSNTLKCI